MKERIALYWRPAVGTALVAVLLTFAATSPALAQQTGHAWAWGNNSYGQLGDGTDFPSSIPVQVRGYRGSGFLDQVRSVDGGAGHSVAKVRMDFPTALYPGSISQVFAWGLNSDGQLGDESTSKSFFPTYAPHDWRWSSSDYPLTAPDVDGVSAGSYHTLYAHFRGEPSSWGRNTSGELGMWDISPYREHPRAAYLPNGGVTAISGGGRHSLARRLDGTVFAWGENGWGQLGTDSTTDSARPLQVGVRLGGGRIVIALKSVTAIAAGGDFSLALLTDGTVRAWGFNGDGELGDGTTTFSDTPVQVSGLTDVIAIAAGDRHSLAVKRDGTVWSWGYNGFGQLGDGTTTSSATPVQVTGLSGVIALAGGGYHSLALLADGTVRAWGYNAFGQLGDGTTTNSATPVPVVGLDEVFAIGAGTLHSLAVRP